MNFERFGLSQSPFQGKGETLFVPVASRSTPAEHLQQALLDGNGLAVLTSAAGLGKTTLCRELQRRLRADWLVALLQDCGCTTRRSLLQAVLYELGLPYSGLSEQEARLRLFETISERQPELQGLILLVDEAQRLSDRLLEELRSLFNHDVDGVPLVRILLCGDLVLEERLIAPALTSVHQRVVCHETLMPLTHAESARLIDTKIVQAGGDGWEHVFTRAAMELMCLVSDGFPRNLEHLARRSLQLADQRREPRVTVETVRQSLDELKELPLQWNEPANLDAYSAADHSVDELDEGDIVDLRTELGEEDETLSVRIGDEIEVSSTDAEPAAVMEFGWEQPAAAADAGVIETSHLDELFTRSHYENHALVDDLEPALEDTAVFKADLPPLSAAVTEVDDHPPAWEQETIITRGSDLVTSSSAPLTENKPAWIELEVDDRYAVLDAHTRIELVRPTAAELVHREDAGEQRETASTCGDLEAAVLEHVRTIRDEVQVALEGSAEDAGHLTIVTGDEADCHDEPGSALLRDSSPSSSGVEMPEWDVIQPEWLAETRFTAVEIDRSRHVDIDPLPTEAESPNVAAESVEESCFAADAADVFAVSEAVVLTPVVEEASMAEAIADGEAQPLPEIEPSACRVNEPSRRPYSQLFSRLRRLRLRLERQPAKRA